MMTDIINFTDSAIGHIYKIIQSQKASAFRLTVKESGCNGLRYLPDVVSEAHPDDIKMQVKEITVFLDPAAVKYIEGTTIDVVTKELSQTQLVFNNPKVKGTCGCGESFNIEDNK